MRAPRPLVVLAVLLAACSSGGSPSAPPSDCPAASVDDGNICTADACDQATGLVTHTPVSVDDGDPCTVDACSPATGIAHTPVEVDDAIACTADACDPTTGAVTHTPVDAACAPDGYCDSTRGCVPYPVLAAFYPAISYVWVGRTDALTMPSPATVVLSGPAHADTFVELSSDDGSVVVPAGVTILAGEASAFVPVSGMYPGFSNVTATLGTNHLNVTIRAVDPEAPVTLQSLTTPGTPTGALVPGATVTFVVTLDVPATGNGAYVAISMSPQGAGTAPTTVWIPGGQTSAPFDYVDAGTSTWVEVTTTLGASTAHVVLIRPALVINEVDYDQPGSTDADEFVEIHNPSTVAYDLTGVALYLVNGGVSPVASYLRVPLSGSLPAGGYLLVASTTVSAPSVTRIDFPSATNNVQNGPSDAIALVDESMNRVIDAVAYGGAVGAATLGALPGTHAVMENAPAPADVLGSICRIPNGVDTDDNSRDFSVCSTSTPGMANAP